MKTTTHLFSTIILALGTLYAEPIRIMPLGDSITYDSIRGDTRSSSKVSGYRNYLWYKLQDVSYSVDFVGSEVAGESVYPSFDPDNEGHPGWKSDEIAAHTLDFMLESQPDIVLLHIGTNDRGSTSPNGVDSILNQIDTYERDHDATVRVIVALIIDRKEHDGRISIFNRRLKELVGNRIHNNDTITLVDMYNDAGLLSNDYIDATHPNNSGYQKMANLWFQEIIKPYNQSLHSFPYTIASSANIDSIHTNASATQITFNVEIPIDGIIF